MKNNLARTRVVTLIIIQIFHGSKILYYFEVWNREKDTVAKLYALMDQLGGETFLDQIILKGCWRARRRVPEMRQAFIYQKDKILNGYGVLNTYRISLKAYLLNNDYNATKPVTNAMQRNVQISRRHKHILQYIYMNIYWHPRPGHFTISVTHPLP